MEFEDVLAQTVTLLQGQGRISYGALKRRLQLALWVLRRPERRLHFDSKRDSERRRKLILSMSPA